MRLQQQIWIKEHQQKGTLPSMADTEPASGVEIFTKWLVANKIKIEGRCVDIGSGKGRNSIYLAKKGLKMWGLEYVTEAIAVAKELAEHSGVKDTTHFLHTDIDTNWPFESNYFDFAIDSFSSIDIETKQGREKCRDEMLRTLKPHGYALVTVCSADDEWESELIKNHPGPEPNSTLWPQNGKFQKDYDETELRDFYKSFEIIELKRISKPAHKLGRDGTATNLWLVLRKKETM